ncbi:class I SAM-dependent methyltransferase [Vreelandella sp. EE22]
MSTSPSLAMHYQQGLRDTQVLEQIRRHYPDGATPYQLAPLDQLHIGGINASQRLLKLLNPAQHPRVLDIGSGLGGLMRLGTSLGFHMIGVDITHRFNALNRALARLGTQTSNAFVVTGDARRLPFESDTFDAVVFQHSLMNMPELAPVMDETRRVLRPGGKVVMHEITRGDTSVGLHFPVPWAATQTHSHLVTLQALMDRLETCGFDALAVEDLSNDARAWRARQSDKEKSQNSTPVLSPEWVFGERFSSMGRNLLENLANRAINVVEISARC